MKQITQTGHIPIDSIGALFGNYLKFFKVYFVFYVIPFISILAAFYFTCKEQIITVIQSVLQYMMFAKIAAGNKILLKPAEEALEQSISNLYSSPSAVILIILSVILMLICMSCLFIGLKHTFYKKVSIVEIMKEGFRKTLWFLWTMVSMQLIAWLVGMIIALFIIVFGIASAFLMPLMLSALGKSSVIIAMMLFYIVIYIAIFSVFIFYIPIHFFSANNPFSSAVYSFKTFWGNILSMIVLGLAFAIIGIVFSAAIMIIICMPIYMYLKGHYPDLPIDMLRFRFFCICIPIAYLILPYTTVWGWINNLMVFIAYPELLDENEVDNTNNSNNNRFSSAADYDSNGDYPALPTEFFKGSAIRKIAENSSSSQSKTAAEAIASNPVVKPSNAGSGLSMPSNHANNRPFLNQKLDQTEFDRLTSKDKK